MKPTSWKNATPGARYILIIFGQTDVHPDDHDRCYVCDQRARCICLREHFVLLWRAEQIRQIWWDVCTVLRCLLPMHICSWIRQVYPELCFPAAIATLLIKQRKGMQEFISQKIYRTRGRDSRRRSATRGRRRIKSCTTFPSMYSQRYTNLANKQIVCLCHSA